MCTAISTHSGKEKIEKKIVFRRMPDTLPPLFYKNAFSFPKNYVVTQEQPNTLNAYAWGLIPGFVKDLQKAQEIRLNTVNAKSETIFEKISFRESIQSRRCLVFIDGFFEYRHVNKLKYPYYIRLREEEPFALGGIYNEWKFLGESYSTFSVITTPANELMSEIHNSKLRMPLIIDPADYTNWLDPQLSKPDITDLMRPYADDQMHAHSVQKLKAENAGSETIIKPYNYPELQARLF
jgi:putative SOS response-associated peptidase YedK